MKKQRSISILLGSVCCLLNSCAFFFNDSQVRRGNLSEAMEKASDDREGSRQVADSRRTERASAWSWIRDSLGQEESSTGIRFGRPPSPLPRYTPGLPAPQSDSQQSGDTAQTKPVDTLLIHATDSGGSVDLNRYRLELDEAFVCNNRIHRITIAASDSTGQRRAYVIERSRQDSTVTPTATDQPPEEWSIFAREDASYVGLRVFTGLKYSSKYSNITGGSLVWAYHFALKRRLAIHLGGAMIPIDARSKLFGSIYDIFQFHFGYQHRIYTTPDHTFMGLFFPIEVTVKSLFWQYRNPVTSDVYDEDGTFLHSEKIRRDGVWGMSLSSGIGTSLVQTRALRLSAEAVGGGTFYFPETHKGFRNDVFPADLFLKLAVEIAFGFR